MAPRGAEEERPRFLLDENVDPRVADGLSRRGVDAVALRDWRDGHLLGRSDEEILRAAKQEHRALVTYDVHTVAPLVASIIESRETHAGVVLVSGKTIPPSDVGGLVRALARLAEMFDDLEGVTLFLERE